MTQTNLAEQVREVFEPNLAEQITAGCIMGVLFLLVAIFVFATLKEIWDDCSEFKDTHKNDFKFGDK